MSGTTIKFLLVMLFISAGLVPWAAAQALPEVVVLNAIPRLDGSNLVDITFRFLSAAGQTANVAFYVSADGGETILGPCLHTTPLPGFRYRADTTYHVLWDAGQDVPGMVGDGFVIRASIDPCVGTEKFTRIIGGSGIDVANDILVAEDGGYLIVGSTTSPPADGTDVWFVKVDPYGTVEWEQRLGGSGNQSANACAQTHDGGYVLVGATDSATQSLQGLVIRVDSQGAELWSVVRGGPYGDTLDGVVQTSDARIFCAGTLPSATYPGGQGWLLELDDTGSFVNESTYVGNFYGSFVDLIMNTDGELVMCGDTRRLVSNDSDAWLVRADRDGSQLNNSLHSPIGGCSDSSHAVAERSGGGYVLFGYGRAALWGCHADAYFYYAALSGVPAGTSRLCMSTGDDRFRAGIVARDGGIVGVGQCGNGVGILMLKQGGSSGSWTRYLLPGVNATSYAVIQTPDDGYVIAGSAPDPTNGSTSAILIKVDFNGISCPESE